MRRACVVFFPRLGDVLPPPQSCADTGVRHLATDHQDAKPREYQETSEEVTWERNKNQHRLVCMYSQSTYLSSRRHRLTHMSKCALKKS